MNIFKYFCILDPFVEYSLELELPSLLFRGTTSDCLKKAKMGYISIQKYKNIWKNSFEMVQYMYLYV